MLHKASMLIRGMVEYYCSLLIEVQCIHIQYCMYSAGIEVDKFRGLVVQLFSLVGGLAVVLEWGKAVVLSWWYS
jgi:hypothetical protein